MFQDKRNRPRIQLERLPVYYALDIIGAIALAVAFAYLASVWDALPDRVPSDFNAAGQPTEWSSRWLLLLLPGMALAFFALFTVVARYPHSFNYLWPITAENAKRQYRAAVTMMLTLRTYLAVFLSYTTYQMIQAAQGSTAGLGTAFYALLLLLPVILAVYFRAAWQGR